MLPAAASSKVAQALCSLPVGSLASAMSPHVSGWTSEHVASKLVEMVLIIMESCNGFAPGIEGSSTPPQAQIMDREVCCFFNMAHVLSF